MGRIVRAFVYVVFDQPHGRGGQRWPLVVGRAEKPVAARLHFVRLMPRSRDLIEIPGHNPAGRVVLNRRHGSGLIRSPVFVPANSDRTVRRSTGHSAVRASSPPAAGGRWQDAE